MQRLRGDAEPSWPTDRAEIIDRYLREYCPLHR